MYVRVFFGKIKLELNSDSLSTHIYISTNEIPVSTLYIEVKLTTRDEIFIQIPLIAFAASLG